MRLVGFAVAAAMLVGTQAAWADDSRNFSAEFEGRVLWLQLPTTQYVIGQNKSYASSARFDTSFSPEVRFTGIFAKPDSLPSFLGDNTRLTLSGTMFDAVTASQWQFAPTTGTGNAIFINGSLQSSGWNNTARWRTSQKVEDRQAGLTMRTDYPTAVGIVSPALGLAYHHQHQDYGLVGLFNGTLYPMTDGQMTSDDVGLTVGTGLRTDLGGGFSLSGLLATDLYAAFTRLSVHEGNTAGGAPHVWASDVHRSFFARPSLTARLDHEVENINIGIDGGVETWVDAPMMHLTQFSGDLTRVGKGTIYGAHTGGHLTVRF